MRFGKAFLAVVILFAMTCSISAYTVLLKNGKRVEGILVEDKTAEILIRDKDGIVLTFRKATLDLDAMSKLNVTSDGGSADTPDEETCCDAKPAIENRSTESKRVFTNEDLKDLPELSIMGPDPAELVDDEIPDSLSPEAEMYWKEQTRELATRLYEAEDNYNYVKKQCEDAKAAFAWYVLNGYWGAGMTPYDPSYVCDGAEQVRAEYERWKDRLETLQEQARQEGALPGWVDPERLNQ